MIRASRHATKFTNEGKQQKLKAFLNEYRRMAALILDYLWENPYHFNNKTLDIANKLYDCPRFISTTELNIDTTLSARALKCCSTQVCSMIKAVTEKPRKRMYMLEKLQAEEKPTNRLQKAIAKQKITKPTIKTMKAELNSICCDFEEISSGDFDGFVQLKSLGKSFGKIRIPIKNHRHSNKLKSKGKLKNSFLISNKTIDLRWELPQKPLKTIGTALGADQGFKDVLTLSDKTTTPKHDNHNHSLETITRKLARKKKGSKAFAKAQDHRKNFIHWSINQLNFTNTKELKLENIINIQYKKKTSRLMSHWCNSIIRDKLKSKCEEEEVLFTLQPSAYRSQRCFLCGWVRKANRKRKQFTCLNCGYASDADLNAAQNLTLDLPEISFALRNQQLNLVGFFWKPEGFSFDGEEFTVSLSLNKEEVDIC